MAQIISNKSTQGFTSVLSATDTPIQTFQQVQSNTANIVEVNGETVNPVPATKKLVITSITYLISATGLDLDIYNSGSSASASGTNVGSIISDSTFLNTPFTQPVYWVIPAGNYVVLSEGGGGKAKIYLQGYITDV
mgnify:FL=1